MLGVAEASPCVSVIHAASLLVPLLFVKFVMFTPQPLVESTMQIERKRIDAASSRRILIPGE